MEKITVNKVVRLTDDELERRIRDEPVSTDNQRSGKTWRDGLITARELQTKQFKPVRIILPDLIPEGVTILAGKPKIGKCGSCSMFA
jgi:hypothetical protein